MKNEKLQNAVGAVDEDLVLRASVGRKKKSLWKWTSAVAAVLAVAFVAVTFLRPGGFMSLDVQAIGKAVYPEMAQYPGNERLPGFDGRYDAWRADVMARRSYHGASSALKPFLQTTAAALLSQTEGENVVYSPLNIYMALAMLAELTDGESRAQILELVGAADIETLRTQANAVWRANYSDDGAVTSILASSLWLSENVAFRRDTMQLLADNYFASSYSGEMGSASMNAAIQKWLNDQTGGLLKDYISDVETVPEALMVLATTMYFRAKWTDAFLPRETEKRVFHGALRDVNTDFMRSTDLYGTYYWGEKFSASKKALEGSGAMWFMLPDEGVSVDELLKNEEALAFLTSNGKWENQKTLIVHLSVPKFDVSSKIDLTETLQTLGVTDCFSFERADFSPMLEDAVPVALSAAEHGARVAIDEEGVTAAAYTVMQMCGSAMPPNDEIAFTLDRPFLFAVTGEDGSVLFIGVVNQP